MGLGRTSADAPGLGQGPGDGSDVWAGSHGDVPQNEKPEDSKAKANPTFEVSEQRDDGPETYVEVRGPASLGARSSVPYLKALPKYQKHAEEAISKQRIPKSKQKRVRDYFDSLQRGKK